MVSVYVSSTYRDLKDYRDAVISALRRMNHHVVCMEEYGAADQRPLERCLRDVDQCDVYVGIFAWQYGYVPRRKRTIPPAARSPSSNIGARATPKSNASSSCSKRITLGHLH